jgi:predicted amidophosphoribosyltransferase
LVSGFKDGGRLGLAPVLADLIVDHTPRPAGTALVPIPLSAGREARRGFNQSQALAAALAERWDASVCDVLQRTGPERSQRGAGVAARVEHVRGVFTVRRGIELPPSVCLVDDVHTTGATLASAAQALWLCGVRKITARSFARALRRG